jgi:ABC-type multidrug transport system ATPase subunit
VRLVCRLRGVSEDAAAGAIERVGLADHASRSIRQLSQGQRRRAVLASAWVGEPSVLLLDEPLEAMDRAMRDEVIEWIRDSAAHGRTAVVASHDFGDLVDTAVAALSVHGGAATIHTLPDGHTARAALLDSLARGS